MRFTLSILLIAILSACAEYFLPWWCIAIVAFLVVLLMRPGKSFLAGFLGVGICWLVAACWQDAANEHILSTRMAGVFGLPHYGLFILVTVIIGALVGGLAAWAGGLLNPRPLIK